MIWMMCAAVLCSGASSLCSIPVLLSVSASVALSVLSPTFCLSSSAPLTHQCQWVSQTAVGVYVNFKDNSFSHMYKPNFKHTIRRAAMISGLFDSKEN